MNCCFVYPPLKHSASDSERPGHPSHQGFQDTIDAESYQLPTSGKWAIPGTFLEDLSAAYRANVPEAEIYVLENVNALYVAPTIRKQHPDATILLLAAHGVFGLDSYRFDDAIPKRAVRYLDRVININLIQHLYGHLDGVLAISEYVANYVRDRTNAPVEAVYPYIQPEMYNRLQDGSPEIELGRAAAVCEHRDHKGIDMLVQAWPQVRSEHPDADLHLIGEGHSDHYQDTPGVHVRGFVENLHSELFKSDLIVHPARRDAFGVAVIEGMLAGSIPIVTNTTGAKEVVAPIEEQLVCDPHPESLSATVTFALSKSKSQRETWREAARERARNYNETKQLERFRNNYHRLLDRINTVDEQHATDGKMRVN